MIKIYFRLMFVLSALLLAGCGGGGGGSSTTTVPSEIPATGYVNNKLPEIRENTIPDILLGQKLANQNMKRLHKEIGEQSPGYIQLSEKATFFYKKQLQMNMELGYMDSVWEQVEAYCQEKKICNIPNGEIVFTYTEALYKRDIELITNYEKKTGIKYQDDGITKEDLRLIIGLKVKLSSAKLTIDDAAEYKYTLTTVQSGEEEINPTLERSIIKWNDDNSNYLIREEVETSGKQDWTQFEYSEIDGEKVSIFSSVENFLGEQQEILEFREKGENVYFVQDIPNDFAAYHAEGHLRTDGGDITESDSEGYYWYEKFDENGYIIETVSCITNTTEISPIPIENGLCTLTGEDAIKNIIIKNVYKVGPFLSVANVNVQKEHSMITFDQNNTVKAIVNCSTFTAKYTIDKQGIWFSDLVEENNQSLTCLAHDLEDNYIDFMNNGFSFGENGYSVEFDLMAELETIGEKDTFDYQKFIQELSKDKYVDSYTMNALAYVTTWDGLFYNPQDNSEYFLGTAPSMEIKNEKIYIDLIDATFVADIVVIDNDRIKFKNIVRTDKQNVIYPIRDCTDMPGENECIDGYSANKQYEDRIFADVIETFLNDEVYVSNEGIPDSNTLWIHSQTLSFHVYLQKLQ